MKGSVRDSAILCKQAAVQIAELLSKKGQGAKKSLAAAAR